MSSPTGARNRPTRSIEAGEQDAESGPEQSAGLAGLRFERGRGARGGGRGCAPADHRAAFYQSLAQCAHGGDCGAGPAATRRTRPGPGQPAGTGAWGLYPEPLQPGPGFAPGLARLWCPGQFRRARPAGAGRWCAADHARWPDRTGWPGSGPGRAHGSAARAGFGALWQCRRRCPGHRNPRATDRALCPVGDWRWRTGL